ncbi:MAG: glycosyltransferase family 4 protein [Chloroflexi bacterium]|nr:glycosyltransferase family 4 protein [Chloroflexota bacterium]
MVRTTALLVNNPFQTDSRVWKMAHTLTDAGYAVTVVARTAPGLPAYEQVDGFRVLRVVQPQPLAWLPSPRLPAGEAEAAAGRASAPGPVAQARLITAATLGRGAQALRYLRLSRAWADAIGQAIDHAPALPGRDPAEPIDVWQAEGLVALPVAVRLRATRGGLGVYDARDLATQSARFARLPGPWRALLQRRERDWARSMDGLLTVSTPYAEVLAQDWGRQPRIAWNGPDHEPVAEARPIWHERLGLAPGTRVVLYLGLVLDGRGIAQLCDAIGLVDDAVLVVAGLGADYERFRERAATLPHADRIHFPGPVVPADIPAAIATADISAMPVEGDTLNHQLNTPTKLFDAMGAGVPVVASDLPGMAPIVRDTGCGELCDPMDPADIARAIRTILDASPERRAAYREACLTAARDVYAWEHQAPVLLDLYRDLVLRGDAL